MNKPKEFYLDNIKKAEGLNYVLVPRVLLAIYGLAVSSGDGELIEEFVPRICQEFTKSLKQSKNNMEMYYMLRSIAGSSASVYAEIMPLVEELRSVHSDCKPIVMTLDCMVINFTEWRQKSGQNR